MELNSSSPKGAPHSPNSNKDFESKAEEACKNWHERIQCSAEASIPGDEEADDNASVQPDDGSDRVPGAELDERLKVTNELKTGGSSVPSKAHYKQLIYQKYQSGVRQMDLLNEYKSVGFSKDQIFRICHGLGRFDNSSHQGRGTALSEFSEVLLGKTVRDLIDDGVKPSMSQVRELAVCLWNLEGHSGEPPTFSENWVKGFNKRHKNLKLTDSHVKPVDARRYKATVEPNVANGLNKYKGVNGKRNSQVVLMDEIDVAVNKKGLGVKRVAVGKTRPVHCAPDNTPHITCAPFISLAGVLEYTYYVVQGQARELKFPHKVGPGVDVSFSKTGSVCSTDGGDGVMSTIDHIMFGFVKNYRANYFPEYPPLMEESYFRDDQDEPDLEVTLIVDGFCAHKEHAVCKFLRRHGVDLMILSPSLTHVIQIGDHSKINGQIQHQLRSLKVDLARNYDRTIPLPVWIWEVHQEVDSVVRPKAVREAAQSVGIRFTGDDLCTLAVNNDTVEEALRKLIIDGRVRRAKEQYDGDYIYLRDPEYLNERNQKRVVEERVVKTFDSVVDEIRREHGEIPTERKQRKVRRPHKGKSTSVSSNNHVYNTAEAIAHREALAAEKRERDLMMREEKARKKQEKEAEKLRALEEKAQRKREREAELSKAREEKARIKRQKMDARDEKARLKRQKMDERSARLQRLQEVFPNDSIERFQKNLKRYLSGGSMTFERAVESIQKLLKPRAKGKVKKVLAKAKCKAKRASAEKQRQSTKRKRAKAA